MSFGLSPSDLIKLITIAHGVYKNYKNSGVEFEQLTKSVASFEAILEEARKALEAIPLDERQEKTFKTFISNSNEVLNDCIKFRTKNAGQGTSVLRRLQWDPKKALNLVERIHREMDSWTAFSNLIAHMHLRSLVQGPHATAYEGALSSRNPPRDSGQQSTGSWQKSSSEQPDCRRLVGDAAKEREKELDICAESDDEYSPGRLSQSSTLGVTPSSTGEGEKRPGTLFTRLEKQGPYAFNPVKQKARAVSESSVKTETRTIKSPEVRRKSIPLGFSAKSIGQQRSPFSS